MKGNEILIICITSAIKYHVQDGVYQPGASGSASVQVMLMEKLAKLDKRETGVKKTLKRQNTKKKKIIKREQSRVKYF